MQGSSPQNTPPVDVWRSLPSLKVALLPALLRRSLSIVVDAAASFSRNDGLAMASHVALSLFITLFPFLVCVAALAAALDAGRISSHIIYLLFDFWPDGVAAPLAKEASKVLVTRTNVLTISIILTVLVSANGVESLRIALHRAYGAERTRSWWQRRLIGLSFVVIGAAILVASSVLLVLWPVLWRNAVAYAPDLKGLRLTYDAVRYVLASMALVIGLVSAHFWLPDTRVRLREVMPGVAVTLALWLVGATAFGQFLAHFTHLKTTYAGLAGIVTALIFLQLSAAFFIFGAELNAAIRRGRVPAGLAASRRTEATSLGSKVQAAVPMPGPG